MTARWVVWAAVGIAGVASVLLPIEPAVRPGREPPSEALLNDLRELDLRLRTAVWADSLGRRLLEGDGPRPLVEGPAGFPGGTLALERELVAGVATSVPKPAAGVPIGRFWMITDGVDDPLRPSAPLVMIGVPSVSIAGRSDGGAYCAQVTPLSTSALERYSDGDEFRLSPVDQGDFTLVGSCWFVIRHGLPGGHVADWMTRAAPSLASSADSERSGRIVKWSEQLGMFRRQVDGAPLIGPRIDPRRFLTPTAQACLGGSTDACARLVTDAETDDLPPVYPGGDVRMVTANGWPDLPSLPEVVDPAFLSRLESHFGPDGFRAFWTSELELEPAFEAAFGISLGRYVMNRAHETYGEVSPGPGVDVAGWWGLLFAIAIGVGSGALVSGRRRLA